MTGQAATELKVSPKHLWLLMLTYAMVIVLANWFDPRLVQFWGLITDAGTIIFPLTFLLSDMITEVYGYKHTRRAIWCGFLFNAVFIIYSQIIIHLPSPEYAINNTAFDQLLSMNIRIIIASTISYLISEPLNSYVMARLKIKTQGQYMPLRFIVSTIFAAGCDSTIFSLFAFYGTMPNTQLTTLILDMWLIKVLIEILGLPISIKLTRKLKQTEQLDIYDRNTKFNLFSLNINYKLEDNQFQQQPKDK